MKPKKFQATLQPRRILFLLDLSGSAFGQVMRLIRTTMVQLMASLSPRDSFAAVWYNRRVGLVLRNCSSGFVYATSRNKRLLLEELGKLEVAHVANFPKALNFTLLFLQEQKEKDGDAWEKTNEQRLILFLTDGTEEWAEEVFDSFAPPDADGKRSLIVRFFTLAMGIETTLIPSAQWLACQGKGLYTSIKRIIVIPERLREIQTVLSQPLAQYYRDLGNVAEREVTWTGPYMDAQGSGVVFTLSMPLLDNRINASQQSFAGVVALDVKLSDVLDLLKGVRGDANVYGLGMRETGALVFHPEYRNPEPEIQLVRKTACFVIPETGLRGRSIERILFGPSTDDVSRRMGLADNLLTIDVADLEPPSEQLDKVRRAMLEGVCDRTLYKSSDTTGRMYTCRTLKDSAGKRMKGLSIAVVAKGKGKLIQHSETWKSQVEIAQGVPLNSTIFLPNIKACKGATDFAQILSSQRMSSLRSWLSTHGKCEGSANTRRMFLDLAGLGPWLSKVTLPKAEWNESCYSEPEGRFLVPKSQLILTDGGLSASPDRCSSRVPSQARLLPRRALFWDATSLTSPSLTFSFDDTSSSYFTISKAIRLPEDDYVLAMVGVELWRSDFVSKFNAYFAADANFLFPCFNAEPWRACFVVTRDMEVVWSGPTPSRESLPRLTHLSTFDPSLFAWLLNQSILIKHSRYVYCSRKRKVNA